MLEFFLRSFLCNSIWKTGCTYFTESLLNILTVKLDSPSEKPVKNQGFMLSVAKGLKLHNGFVDIWSS